MKKKLFRYEIRTVQPGQHHHGSYSQLPASFYGCQRSSFFIPLSRWRAAKLTTISSLHPPWSSYPRCLLATHTHLASEIALDPISNPIGITGAAAKKRLHFTEGKYRLLCRKKSGIPIAKCNICKGPYPPTLLLPVRIIRAISI